MSVLIGIPSGNSSSYAFRAHYVRFLWHNLQKGLVSHVAEICSARGDRNRNSICQQLLTLPPEVEAVFFMEEDHIYPQAAIEVMLKCPADVVCGFYVHRQEYWPQLFDYAMPVADPIEGVGMSHRPMLSEVMQRYAEMGVPEDFLGTAFYLEGVPDEVAYLPVKAGGTGFMLVRRGILTKMREKGQVPWFGKELGTEGDLMFFRRVLEAGGTIMADLRLGAAHLTLMPMGLPHFRQRFGTQIGKVYVYIPTTADNTDGDPQRAQVERLRKRVEETAGLPVRVFTLHDPQRYGYVANVNRALRELRAAPAATQPDYVAILVDDCWPTQARWLAHLIEPMLKYKDVWAVGPTVNCTLPQRDPAFAGSPEVDMDFISGACFVMRWKKQPYLLDEAFRHYYGDCDLFLRMRKDGKRVLWLPYVTMGGHVPTTQDPNWQQTELAQWWQQDEALFFQRYPERKLSP